MNSNPIDELRNMRIPVSEEEWESIVHDKRYLKKFGKRSRVLSKGRAALIAGAAAILVTIPILVITLTHKPADTAQSQQSVEQVTENREETNNNTPSTVPTVTQSPVVIDHSEATSQMLPSATNTTANAATHEQNTLAIVTDTRVQSTSRPDLTNVTPTAPTAQPTEYISPTPEKPVSATVAENKKSRPVVDDNRPQAANNSTDENQPITEKSSEETENEVDNFFIPSAFSPNGDGVNDLFSIKANFEPRDFEMNIYTRRGSLVFHSQNIDTGWDGQLHGQTLPSNVYVYIIRYTDREGKPHKRQGQVLLLQ